MKSYISYVLNQRSHLDKLDISQNQDETFGIIAEGEIFLN